MDSTAEGRRALPFESLSRHWHFGDFGYGKVLSIIDACRNEFNWQTRGARGFHSSRDIELALNGNKLVEVLYSCSEGEVSWEDDTLAHGIFTHSLLEVMRQHDGELDTHRLSGLTNDQLQNWCRSQGGRKRQRARRYYEPSEKNRIVLLAGIHRQKQVNSAATAVPSSQLVLCPLCGGYNPKEHTFRCKGCDADHLCRSHQDPAAFVCITCLEKRKRTSAAKPKPAGGPKEVKRDGRFIAYADGTVVDSETNLMWAAADNGEDINWPDAKRYCESYQGGGHRDWRLPTQDELYGLYEAGVRVNGKNDLIRITEWWCWASETKGSGAAGVGFSGGDRYFVSQINAFYKRVLPVRRAD
jgi:hypothetical protein